MSNFLVEHAIKNTWCSPDQDKQHILRPARISREEGNWNKIKVLMKTIILPNADDRFHVYQVGQLYPIILGLFPLRQTWINFATCCEEQKMSLDIYSDKGIRYPNHLIWYRFTQDRNLIIAIAEHKAVPITLNKENIYLRVYSNAYFASVESSQIDDVIKNEGATVSDLTSIISFQQKISLLANKPGYTYCFVNGFLVNKISPFTARNGDVVEYFHDGSIYKTIDFKIKDLEVFNSIKDSRRKYIIHPAKDSANKIEYFDDIDFYLFTKLDTNIKGVYYHKNQVDAVRMITHRDYSIQVPYVVSLNDSIVESTDPEELTLRLHVRKSGYNRPLVQEHNRLHELYKLNDTDIIRALAGIDSTIVNWKAETLELSAYVDIMNYLSREIPISLIETAYGYNAISKLIGNSPIFSEIAPDSVGGLIKIINVPYNLQSNSSIYEYDQEGKLVTWNNHDIGSVFPCDDYNTRLAELFVGTSGFDLDDFYGDQLTLDTTANYRFYISPIINGIKQNKWTDVTGSSKYAIVNNKATWLVTGVDYERIIRSDKKILSYDLSLMHQYGVIRFPLMQVKTINGVTAARPLEVPTGELDIFLNRKPVINGLDYSIDFPFITIRNKEYLNQPEFLEQQITIRAKGFCTSELKQDPDEDYGFVCFGMLSANNKFDIRDDKVLRIIIDGSLKDRSDLTFAENSNGIIVGDSVNGRPYLIRDVVVPTKGLTLTSTNTLRQSSLEVDNAISNYMTLKHPEVKRNDLFTIPERYQIYSPFCAKIIHDLKYGLLNDSRLKDHYGDDLVLELCKPYGYLLKVDPCHDNNYPDDRFVDIHPHHLFTIIDVNAYTYKFISKVVKVILKDRVNISHFLRIVL